MPRDGSETRERLVAAAEELFAEVGIYRVTVREIVEAAGQKNVSAISYHFGSREGLLEEILLRHGESVDAQRGELLVLIDETSPTAAIVDALVRPMTTLLDDRGGRRYVRIVDQFPAEMVQLGTTTPFLPTHLSRALDLLVSRPTERAEAVRRERVLSMILLMTASLASRARALERGGRLELDARSYEANLTDMLVGVIDAPVSVTP